MTDQIDQALNELLTDFISNSSNLFQTNQTYYKTFENGRYCCAILRPSRRMKVNLGVDREVLLIASNFTDQQQRTIKFAELEIASSQGRLEPTIAIVVHLDPDGNSKLRNWGRSVGLSILPIYGRRKLESDKDLEKRLSDQLYTHDPFDVTGPVSGEANFFGRRDEAIDLARKLQQGQIRSCLGIRKIGKTSIISRVLHEIRGMYDCTCIMIDCSRDDVFECSAEQLLMSISHEIDLAKEQEDRYRALSYRETSATLIGARNSIQEAIVENPNLTLLVFDETDYITPGSPTAPHWTSDFNRFWRNLRATYQECERLGKPFSILVGGVSTYWFSIDEIEGIENAALSYSGGVP